MNPKMVMKMFRLVNLGLMCCSIGGLLSVHIDKLREEEINDLRHRVLTLEAQMLWLNTQIDIPEKKEEVDAE